MSIPSAYVSETAESVSTPSTSRSFGIVGLKRRPLEPRRVKGSSPLATRWLLVGSGVLFLFFGTIEGLAAKFMNRQVLPPCEGCRAVPFEAPIFQTWLAYLGELVAFLYLFCWQSIKPLLRCFIRVCCFQSAPVDGVELPVRATASTMSVATLSGVPGPLYHPSSSSSYRASISDPIVPATATSPSLRRVLQMEQPGRHKRPGWTGSRKHPSANSAREYARLPRSDESPLDDPCGAVTHTATDAGDKNRLALTHPCIDSRNCSKRGKSGCPGSSLLQRGEAAVDRDKESVTRSRPAESASNLLGDISTFGCDNCHASSQQEAVVDTAACVEYEGRVITSPPGPLNPEMMSICASGAFPQEERDDFGRGLQRNANDPSTTTTDRLRGSSPLNGPANLCCFSFPQLGNNEMPVRCNDTLDNTEWHGLHLQSVMREFSSNTEVGKLHTARSPLSPGVEVMSWGPQRKDTDERREFTYISVAGLQNNMLLSPRQLQLSTDNHLRLEAPEVVGPWPAFAPVPLSVTKVVDQFDASQPVVLVPGTTDAGNFISTSCHSNTGQIPRAGQIGNTGQIGNPQILDCSDKGNLGSSTGDPPALLGSSCPPMSLLRREVESVLEWSARNCTGDDLSANSQALDVLSVHGDGEANSSMCCWSFSGSPVEISSEFEPERDLRNENVVPNGSLDSNKLILEASVDANSETKCPVYYWALPIALDFCGIVMINAALISAPASTVQVIRTLNVVVIAAVSVLVFYKRLKVHQVVAIGLITFGTLASSVYLVIGADVLGGSSGKSPWLGAGLALGGTIISALVMVYEEYLIKRYRSHPLEAVGWMGLFGVSLSTVMLVAVEGYSRTLFMLKLGFQSGNEHLRSTSVNLIQGSVAMVLAVSIFNSSSMGITAFGSALLCSLLLAARTFLIWALELILRWSPFHALNLCGVVVASAAVVIYNWRSLPQPLNFLKESRALPSMMKQQGSRQQLRNHT